MKSTAQTLSHKAVVHRNFNGIYQNPNKRFKSFVVPHCFFLTTNSLVPHHPRCSTTDYSSNQDKNSCTELWRLEDRTRSHEQAWDTHLDPSSESATWTVHTEWAGSRVTSSSNVVLRLHDTTVSRENFCSHFWKLPIGCVEQQERPCCNFPVHVPKEIRFFFFVIIDLVSLGH